MLLLVHVLIRLSRLAEEALALLQRAFEFLLNREQHLREENLLEVGEFDRLPVPGLVRDVFELEPQLAFRRVFERDEVKRNRREVVVRGLRVELE